MSLSLSTRINPCPICEITDGRCRQSSDDTNFWLCMSASDSKAGQVINGYKCLGQSSDGIWGEFKFDNSSEWTENQRREWQDRKRQRTENQHIEEAIRRSNSLSVDERNKNYQTIKNQLSLHPDDKGDLRKRGFTNEQMERSGFKSVTKFQELLETANRFLPGVGPSGQTLASTGGGYLCPALDLEGRICAYQIRLRGADDGVRYKWVSTSAQTLHLFPEGCAPGGELPLTIRWPQGKPKGIALAEGIGPKPFLVAERLALITIGAAGGQWSTSPVLFREMLEAASKIVESKLVNLYIDAGDIINPQVVLRWKRVLELLLAWGFEPRIAWWGQITKQHNDVDELSLEEIGNINYLTPEAFRKLCNNPDQVERETEPKKGALSEFEAIAKSVNSDLPEDRPQEPRAMWARAGGDLSTVCKENALSSVERDRQYQQILIQLGTPKVAFKQKIEGNFNLRLPGILPGGQLTTAGGCLRALRDIDGYIVALIEETQEGASWLVAPGQTLQLFPEGCAPKGEMPLGVFKKNSENTRATKIVLFVEGAGLKAAESTSLHTTVIGSPGGLWAESPNLLKAIIDKEVKKCKALGKNAPQFEIAPDAGGFDDEVVMGRIEALYNLLEEWGHTPRIKFWNQTEPGDPNIDQVQMVTVNRVLAGKRIKTRFEKEELYELHELREAVRVSRWKRKRDETIAQAQSKLRNLSYRVNLVTSESGKYLPNDLIDQLPTSGLIAIKAPKGAGKSWQISRFITQKKKSGHPVLSITPRIALGREQAFKWGINWIDDCGIKRYFFSKNHEEEILKLALEIQKHEELLQKLKQDLEMNLFDSTKFGIDEQIKAAKKVISQAQKEIDNLNDDSIRTMGLCWDSLWKTSNWDLSQGVIIVDEAELGITHLLTSATTRRRRPELLKIFKDKIDEVLRSGGTVLLADADLTDVPIDYVKSLVHGQDIEPFVVVHEHPGLETKWAVTLYRGRNRNSLIDVMMVASAQGKTIAIATDSQVEAEALERQFVLQHPEVILLINPETGEIDPEAEKRDGRRVLVRLDGRTSQTKAGKAFLERPNFFLKKYDVKIQIYTPTMGVGVSIDEDTTRINQDGEVVPYFDALYGLAFGSIEPSQFRQQLGRIRANVPRIVWVADWNNYFSGCRETLPEDVKKWALNSSEEGVNLATILAPELGNMDEMLFEEAERKLRNFLFNNWDKEHQCVRNPHIDTYAKIQARRNFGLLNLGDQLLEELRAEGHDVRCSMSGGKGWIKALKEQKEEILLESATEMEAADLMLSVEEAQEVLKQASSTHEERLSAQKTILANDLPGIDLTQSFLYKAIFKDRRSWLRGHTMFWMMGHQSDAADRDSKSLSWNYFNYARYEASCWDDFSYTARLKAIQDSGLFSWIDLNDLGKIYDHRDPEAKEFLKRAIKIKERLGRLFNIYPTPKTYPRKLAEKLIGKIGLGFTNVTNSNSDARFKIDTELFNDADRWLVLSAFDRKYKESLAEKETRLTPQCVMYAPQIDTVFDLAATEKLLSSSNGLTHTQHGVEYGGNELQIITNGSVSPQAESEDPPPQIEMRPTPQIDTPLWVTDDVVGQRTDDQIAEEGSPGLLQQIIEDFAICDCIEAVSAVVEAYSLVGGCDSEVLQEAATMQDTMVRRNQLRRWLEQLKDYTGEPAGGQLPCSFDGSPAPIKQGCRVKVEASGVARCRWVDGLAGLVQHVTKLGRCLVEFMNGRIEYFDDSELSPLLSG